MIIKKSVVLMIGFYLFTCRCGYTNFPQTVQELSESCEKINTVDEAFCMGYIEAAVNNGNVLCLPSGVHVKQTVKVFVKWVSNHPEQLHIQADRGLFIALDEAFPCKNFSETMPLNQYIANSKIIKAKNDFASN